jgi:site-specific DNA-methyltransferase (adenine-specific)
MEIVKVPLKEIRPYENHARLNDNAVKEMAQIITDMGFNSPLELTEDKYIIDGHLRYKAAKMLGMKEVPCIIHYDMTKEEIAAYRIAVNKTAEEATWDYETLTVEIQELAEDNYNINNLGFANEILIELLNGKKESELKDGETMPDAIPLITEKINSNQGSVYQLGKHRLLVGDSNVEKLLKDKRAKMLLSCMKNGDERDFAKIKTASKYLKASGSFYFFCQDKSALNIEGFCRDCNLEVMENIIARKNIFQHKIFYPSSNETILYGKHKNSENEWFGDRKETNYFDCNVSSSGYLPLSIRIKLLKNSSQMEDIVLDINAENGGTIIACEQSDRICYAVTDDCAKADLIRKRYAEFVYGTGCDYIKKTQEEK